METGEAQWPNIISQKKVGDCGRVLGSVLALRLRLIFGGADAPRFGSQSMNQATLNRFIASLERAVPG